MPLKKGKSKEAVSDNIKTEMAAVARLLVELEWAGSESDGCCGSDPICPICYERAPHTIHFPAKRINAYTREEAHDKTLYGIHKPDCRLIAVLRKAGVRE